MKEFLTRIWLRGRREGAWAVLLLSGRRLFHLVDSFVEDWVRGVRTARQDRLPGMRALEPANHFYRATSYRTFRQIMRQVSLRPGEDVFVDYGSGKGRVVLLAAGYPFRRVIGVEYARELHELALGNLAAARHRLCCAEVELVCADATEWPVPATANVLFFFNPFDGLVLARVCARIRESLRQQPRQLTLIYVRPEMFLEQARHWQDWLKPQQELSCIEGRTIIFQAVPTNCPDNPQGNLHAPGTTACRPATQPN